ncbi:MAG: hypothetical protein J6K42_04605 [Clostridia bacterium]|nr:hypothetical protein [Clostridia bacterium]
MKMENLKNIYKKLRTEVSQKYPDAKNVKLHILHFGYAPLTQTSVYVTFLSRNPDTGKFQLSESNWHTLEKFSSPYDGREKLEQLSSKIRFPIKYHKSGSYFCDEIIVTSSRS